MVTIPGTAAIKKWNEETNDTYRTVLEPFDLIDNGNEMILKTSISGNFERSPIMLDFYFTIENDTISSLKIG